MTTRTQENDPFSRISRILILLLDSPILNTLHALWGLCRRLLKFLPSEGMYEVLEYESRLELLDAQGEHASFHKRQRVRFLQNDVIAYQDQAWGDGEILINYCCTPGQAVDIYRPGRKTYILISLREVKSRGDIEEFNIDWGIRDGFLRQSELWGTEINHPTERLKIQVLFPESRPPRRAVLLEETRRRTHGLGQGSQVQLPDGRWVVSWETHSPRLHENYMLKWEW